MPRREDVTGKKKVQILRCGWQVPGLYTPEELDPLLMPLREQAAHEDFRGSQFTYFALREYFVIVKDGI